MLADMRIKPPKNAAGVGSGSQWASHRRAVTGHSGFEDGANATDATAAVILHHIRRKTLCGQHLSAHLHASMLMSPTLKVSVCCLAMACDMLQGQQALTSSQ